MICIGHHLQNFAFLLIIAASKNCILIILNRETNIKP